MHQLCSHITNRMSKHMLSKICKGAPKVAPILATWARKKKKSGTIRLRSLKFASVNSNVCKRKVTLFVHHTEDLTNWKILSYFLHKKIHF